MEVASIEEKAKEGPETYRQGNDVGRIVNRFFNVFTKFKTRNDHLPLLAGRII